jgi:hypothetical protein
LLDISNQFTTMVHPSPDPFHPDLHQQIDFCFHFSWVWLEMNHKRKTIQLYSTKRWTPWVGINPLWSFAYVKNKYVSSLLSVRADSLPQQKTVPFLSSKMFKVSLDHYFGSKYQNLWARLGPAACLAVLGPRAESPADECRLEEGGCKPTDRLIKHAASPANISSRCENGLILQWHSSQVFQFSYFCNGHSD